MEGGGKEEGGEGGTEGGLPEPYPPAWQDVCAHGSLSRSLTSPGSSWLKIPFFFLKFILLCRAK